jgi:hypothetical protein
MANDPTTVEKLYTDILGRASDPGGLAYWQQQFGNEVDPNELATFKSAAQAELANRTPTEQTALAPVTSPPPATDINNLISQAYAGIGRSDTGTGLGAVTQGEKDYWAGQIASGAINPTNFQSTFNNAVNSYTTANPNDPYTQYVQNYQAQQSASNPTVTAPLSSVPTNYDKLVQDAYANITGRSGIGNLVNNIDQGSLDYWKNQLASGAIKPEDLNSAFQNAISAYEVANPNDPYTQYVQKYQLGKQADTIKQNLASALADKSISLDEAKKITDYQSKYNFTPEQIASVTGYSVDAIKEILGSQNKILTNVVKTNINNPVGLADFATQNGLTAKQLADASGGAYTEAQVQANLDLAKTFQGRLQLASPDAYNQIKNLTQYTANENFGGKTQDYQVQLFTPLDITKTDIPTQLEFTKPSPITAIDPDTGNPYTYTPQPQVKNPNVTRDDDGNFVSTTPTYVNGVPVTASYDANGKLTGYKGDPRVVTWLDGSHYVYGNWDAQGNAKPAQVATKGGGFIKNIASDIAGGLKDLGPAWTIAKFLQPELNLVDLATSVGQGKFDLGTVVSGLSGYAGLQGADVGAMQTPGGLNSVSGLDLASDIATTGANPAVTALSNASTAKLVAASAVAIDAADKGNYAPILNVVANVSGANKMPEVAIAANTLAAADAITNNNPGALLTAAGNLVGSPDLKLAGAATKFIQAYDSGNKAAITTASAELASSINSNAPDAVDKLKTSILGTTTSSGSGLPVGNTITYDKDGNATVTPAGADTTGVLPAGTNVTAGLDTGVVSDSKTKVGVSGTPIFAENIDKKGTYIDEEGNKVKVKAPPGYEIMSKNDPAADLPTIPVDPEDPGKGAYKSDGSFYDPMQNAWFKPVGGKLDVAEDLNKKLQDMGMPGGSGTDVTKLDNTVNQNPVTTGGLPTTVSSSTTGVLPTTGSTGNVTDAGNITITDKRPVTDLPVTNMGNVTITDKRPVTDTTTDMGTINVTDTRIPTTTVTPPVTTVTPPVTTVTPPTTTVTTPLTTVTPTTTTYVPSTPTTKTPTTASNISQITSDAASIGALPTSPSATMLSTGQLEKQSNMLKELTHLYPQLSNVDPRLLSILSGKARSGSHALGQTNEGGATPLMSTSAGNAPSAGMPFKASSGNAAGLTSSSGSGALARAGLNLLSNSSNISGYAKGGLAEHNPEFITGATGHHVKGEGDGQSDSIPAMLADGEYVFDADTVAALGNGSNDAGARILDKMRENLRKHKRSAPAGKIPPKAKSPLEYMKG